MSNEERILSMLETMQVSINDRFDKLESKVDAIIDQTADLTEFKTQTNREIDDIRAVIQQTMYDVATLKAKVR